MDKNNNEIFQFHAEHELTPQLVSPSGKVLKMSKPHHSINMTTRIHPQDCKKKHKRGIVYIKLAESS